MECISSKRLVTVVVPIYNVEKYIRACVDSITNQTYDNLEILLVDDGTPDNSGIIADELAKSDKRIKVIHKENGGVASARNRGLEEATGDFVVFVDSDDWISEDHIEHLLYLQSINDSDLCFTTKYFTQATDVQTSNITIKKLKPEEAAVLLLSPKLVIGTYNKIYRRSWLIKNNLKQNEQLFSGEGLNYIVTAAEHANHVTVSDKKIYYYRRNVSESATTKFRLEMFTNNELSLDILEKEKIINSYEFNEMLEHFRVHLMISGMLAILNNHCYSKYKDTYNRWKTYVRRNGTKLLRSKNFETRYKIRIVAAIVCPSLWARMARIKREAAYKNSV